MPETSLVAYGGNCPHSVSRDAKYGLHYKDGQWVVGIVYVSDVDERWYPVTGEHPDLVDLVNAVKLATNGKPGGAFYINEYHQVIVPNIQGRDYYLAGEYDRQLEFTFEGHTLSGNALDFKGKPITPGSQWVGPHAGIPYVLAAGAKDVYYDSEPRPDVKKRIRLSHFQPAHTVAHLCQYIQRIKGQGGGRFYINEYCHLFAPVTSGQEVSYIYIEHLDDLSIWFPKPD